jgi:hypothetical protein
LEAEARVLQGEAATEPVPAGGDVAIASEVAAEAHDSATPEHAEAGKRTDDSLMYCLLLLSRR